MRRILDTVLSELSAPPRILIYGGYGFKNVGDEAILSGLLEIIRRSSKGSKVTVVSGDPAETQIMHGVDSCSPLSYKLLEKIVDSDIVILGGGGIVSRVVAYGSKVKAFVPEGKLIHIVGIVSKLLRKRLFYYGVGVTSFPDAVTQKVAAIGLRSADLIVTRDTLSIKNIHSLKVKRKAQFEQDLAFETQIPKPEVTESLLTKEGLDQKRFLIGITWRFVEDQQINQSALKALCATIDYALDKYGQYLSFVYIPISRRISKLGEVGKDDMNVYAAINRGLKPDHKISVLKGRYHPVSVKGIVGSCDLVIGMRLHSIIFSHLTGTPFIAVEYDEKITQFLDSIGTSQPHFKLEKLTEHNLITSIVTAVEETPKSLE